MKKTNNVPQQLKRKHVPERTCVACHEVRPKRDLVRLVYGPDGVAEVDTTGRKPGRGAYLCHSPGCWQKGVNKGKLEHALRGKIAAENRARLMEFGARIGGGNGASGRTGGIS